MFLYLNYRTNYFKTFKFYLKKKTIFCASLIYMQTKTFWKIHPNIIKEVETIEYIRLLKARLIKISKKMLKRFSR